MFYECIILCVWTSNTLKLLTVIFWLMTQIDQWTGDSYLPQSASPPTATNEQIPDCPLYICKHIQYKGLINVLQWSMGLRLNLRHSVEYIDQHFAWTVSNCPLRSLLSSFLHCVEENLDPFVRLQFITSNIIDEKAIKSKLKFRCDTLKSNAFMVRKQLNRISGESCALHCNGWESSLELTAEQILHF